MKDFSRSFCFILFLLTSSLSTYAQQFPFKVAEVFSPNKLTDFNQQRLILLDFWTSDCDPCQPATIQLGLVQPYVADKVFMVAVTNESHNIVAQYTAEHSIKLMILRDWESNIFRQFNVNRGPHAILLTTNGELVWQGHPADLPIEKINQYTIQYRDAPQKKFTELFSVKGNAVTTIVTNTTHSTGPLRITIAAGSQTSLKQASGIVTYTGSLTGLFAKLYRVPQQQIVSLKWDDTNVEFECPLSLWETQPDSLIRFIAHQLEIKISATITKQDVSLVNVSDFSKLWDKSEFRFEKEFPNYQVGTDRLQADNMTLADFCTLLSDVKHHIFKYRGDDYNAYDWDLQYKNDELMINELFNQFSILVRQSKIDLTLFEIE